MSPAGRRMFFALWPGESVRHALYSWQAHNLPDAVRWQHRDDLHMTLHFLGQVDAARLPELRALGDRLRCEPFTLVLDEIGHWPGPQVLWAAPGSQPGALLDLHGRLAAGLEAAGFALDPRGYRPHVTLARKVAQAPLLRPLRPLTWSVTEITLAESAVEQPPHYRPRMRWSLS